jgi:hypothetical protein
VIDIGRINGGLVVLGVSNTLLFSGESTTELLLLNLMDGSEVTLPVSDEQAAVLLEALGLLGEEASEDQKGSHGTPDPIQARTAEVPQL